MKKIKFAFLTFLAAIPSLVCFMAFCPMQSAQASEPVPCHEMAMDSEDGGVMLVSDCMGVDFFLQDTSDKFDLDFQIDTSDFLLSDLLSSYNFEPENVNGIRGPPLESIVISSLQPIYLTTQRFRL